MNLTKFLNNGVFFFILVHFLFQPYFLLFYIPCVEGYFSFCPTSDFPTLVFNYFLMKKIFLGRPDDTCTQTFSYFIIVRGVAEAKNNYIEWGFQTFFRALSLEYPKGYEDGGERLEMIKLVLL